MRTGPSCTASSDAHLTPYFSFPLSQQSSNRQTQHKRKGQRDQGRQKRFLSKGERGFFFRQKPLFMLPLLWQMGVCAGGGRQLFCLQLWRSCSSDLLFLSVLLSYHMYHMYSTTLYVKLYSTYFYFY